ncbi:MAG: hypothetical protein ACOX6I_03365 [Syntrophomonadaceae bacterium]
MPMYGLSPAGQPRPGCRMVFVARSMNGSLGVPAARLGRTLKVSGLPYSLVKDHEGEAALPSRPIH